MRYLNQLSRYIQKNVLRWLQHTNFKLIQTLIEFNIEVTDVFQINKNILLHFKKLSERSFSNKKT